MASRAWRIPASQLPPPARRPGREHDRRPDRLRRARALRDRHRLGDRRRPRARRARAPARRLPADRRRLGRPAAAPQARGLDRPGALRAARAAGGADLHRRGRDLAHRGDRGPVRHRRGVLPPRLHRADPADRARGRHPAGEGRHRHDRDGRGVRRPCARHRARAAGRARLGVPARRADVPGLRRVPDPAAAARARRAGRAPDRDDRAARRLGRGALAPLDPGDRQRVRARRRRLLRAVDDARRHDLRGHLRHARRLRHPRRGDGRRHDRRCPDRLPLAPAPSDAHRHAAVPAVAAGDVRVRGRAAGRPAAAAVRGRGPRPRAVRDLVGDRAGRARAAAHALARVGLRLDGLAAAPAGGLRAGRAARRGVRRARGAAGRQRVRARGDGGSSAWPRGPPRSAPAGSRSRAGGRPGSARRRRP
jgi:hypothetical protein